MSKPAAETKRNIEVCDGNKAVAHAVRLSRPDVIAVYPITPQSEIVEYVAKFPFSKGRIIPVESEHSAMGVCIGAALNGTRTFTASSSNGLAYMAENVMTAAFYRLPVVMAAVNRTLGPPWNIWADQGDTLMFRDFGWVQLYCDSNQDVADTTLLAFRLAEDPRIMLPVMVCMDAFIISHTAMETELATQDQVDRYLPDCNVPQRIDPANPVTIGGMVWPQETISQRLDLDEAIRRVPVVLEEHRKEFKQVFDREVSGPVSSYYTEDAEEIIIASGSVATTAHEIVRQLRKEGRKTGLVQIKMFRPFPADEIQQLCSGAIKIGVLDRNYAAGIGGIFCHEVKACLQGHSNATVQGYLAGVGGGDVVPSMVREAADELHARQQAGAPIWLGIES